MHRTKMLALALPVLLGLAACDRSERTEDAEAAGEPVLMPQDAEDMDAEAMGLIMEVQEIQQRLQPIQQQAMEDETLAAQLEALQSQVSDAMRAENPELFDRIEGLEGEMAAAESAGDMDGMQAIMMRAHGIQDEFQALQAAVIERPEIRGAVDRFEAAYRARMIEIDPEAEAMLDRVEELMAQLGR